MTWHLEYLPDPGIVRVTTAGTMNLAQLKQMTSETLLAGRANRCDRFLVDHREMTGTLSVADIYDLPAIQHALGLRAHHRAAIVFNAASARRDDIKFFELMLLNTGAGNMRAFTEIEPALAWLSAE